MKRTAKCRAKVQALLTGLLALSLGLAAAQVKAQSADSNLNNRAAIQLTATLPAQLRLSVSEINLDIKFWILPIILL